MPISENMVQEIVQEVMAKMQIADAPAGKHGVFKDMNDAIEAAKKAQLVVKTMSMDQREKIITCIRKKIKENAEVLARMGCFPDNRFWVSSDDELLDAFCPQAVMLNKIHNRGMLNNKCFFFILTGSFLNV